MLTYEYHFYGQVQKVSFRRTLKAICDKYHIKGNVKNESTGIVKARFQQEKSVLEEFLSLLRTFLELENTSISIKKVTKKKINTNKKYPRFEILYSSNLNKMLSYFHQQYNRIISKNNKNNIYPKHIVLIPDGNRRWRKKHKLNSDKIFYRKLIKKAENIFSFFNKKQNNFNDEIHFTIWGFSTENWNRSLKEQTSVFNGLDQFLNYCLKKNKFNFKFKHIGRKDRLPEDLLSKLNLLELKTKELKTKFNFNLALDYGGRDEIIRAIKKLNKDDLLSLDEKKFTLFLDTTLIPDPDLIIRTSGEQRLSGIFPFQSVYSELYFTKKYFPDFETKDLEKAIKEFQKRKRNFGK